MITLLLADLAHLHGSFSDAWRLRLARASQREALPLFEGLSQAQWPMVEATYRLDHGSDASAELTWLRLDPASVVPDMNGVVMLGFGHMLKITEAERTALFSDLQPLLDEHGLALHWPLPDRAYLGIPASRKVPLLTPTWEVLGEDLLAHFPGGRTHDEPSRWWRSLINDLQMALHAHPVNEARRLKRVHPINLLWPWRTLGATAKPSLNSKALLQTPNEELLALWNWAGGDAMMRTDVSAAKSGADVLVDLRDVTRCATLEREWLEPAFKAAPGKLDIRSADTTFQIRPTDRFKFWIKSRNTIC